MRRRRTIITKRSWASDAAAAKEATTTFLVINSQFSSAGKQLKVLLSFPSEQRRSWWVFRSVLASTEDGIWELTGQRHGRLSQLRLLGITGEEVSLRRSPKAQRLYRWECSTTNLITLLSGNFGKSCVKRAFLSGGGKDDKTKGLQEFSLLKLSEWSQDSR